MGTLGTTKTPSVRSLETISVTWGGVGRLRGFLSYSRPVREGILSNTWIFFLLTSLGEPVKNS